MLGTAGRAVRLAFQAVNWKLKMPDARMVKLQGPKETTSISVAGESLKVVDGVVIVPERFAFVLASHGFFPYVEVPAAHDLPPVMPSATRKLKA